MIPYLLVGLPRSGTSWVGKSLTQGPGVRYLDEPDGFREPFPFRVMMQYGESPILDPGDPAPDYERLWRGIYSGGLRSQNVRGRIAQAAFDRAGTAARRRARAGDGTSLLLQLAMRTAQPPTPDPDAVHLFVKSVQCIGAVDWIVNRHSPRVIVLFRSLLNTVASWYQLEFVRNPREVAALTAYARRSWGVEPPPPTAPAVAHQTFVVAVHTGMLRCAADRHPEWTVASHEEICLDPPARLRALAETVGLEWTEAADSAVRESDRDGNEPFSTNRVSQREPERWRERLTPDDVSEIRRVIDGFPDEARVEP